MTASSLDSPVRHRRTLASVLQALARPSNYSGILKTFALTDHPISFLRRYIRNDGTYPAQIGLRTPTGRLLIDTYAPDDIQTINEIFFRGDYECGRDAKVIVDFGSNIGISALYFLSRNAEAFCYGYEPLPQNIERFHKNLAPYSGRVMLTEAAVGESEGTVSFGWEPTGRYGGINRETGATIEVPCKDSNVELAAILRKHDQIDLLKVDIETMEKIVVSRIPPDIARRIKTLVVEYPFSENPLAQTHAMSVEGAVAKFQRKLN